LPKEQPRKGSKQSTGREDHEREAVDREPKDLQDKCEEHYDPDVAGASVEAYASGERMDMYGYRLYHVSGIDIGPPSARVDDDALQQGAPCAPVPAGGPGAAGAHASAGGTSRPSLQRTLPGKAPAPRRNGATAKSSAAAKADSKADKRAHELMLW